MKRYLWTAVAVLFMNVNASENPFALKENLLKIDNDQKMLLSELSKVAAEREDAELDIEDDEVEPKKVIDTVSEDTTVKMEDSEEQDNLAHSIDEPVEVDDKKDGVNLVATQEELSGDNQKDEEASIAIAEEAHKQAMEKAAQEAKKAELDALRIAQEKADKEAKEKVKLAEDARETERREVAAYEKQRAEKLAKQAEADAMKKSAEIALETEKKIAAQLAVAKTQTQNAVQSAAKGDIDVKAEKIAATITADEAYLDAVKEMDLED